MSRSLANGLLLIAALIWGTTFVAQQLGMADVGPLIYTGVRFLPIVAFGLIGVVFLDKSLRRGARRTWAWGRMGEGAPLSRISS